MQRRGPDELAYEMDNTWVMENERLSQNLWGRIKTMARSFPLLKAQLESLKKYNIPLALTHGDFSRRNVGFCADKKGKEKIILFDWQYAAVSHPFFDFCEFREKVDEKIVDEYLSQWSGRGNVLKLQNRWVGF